MCYCEHMGNLLLFCILLTNLILLAVFAFGFMKFRSIYRDILEFITPPAENEPSKLANVCQSLSEMVGRSLVAQVKGFLMGKQSGEVRGANAEIGAGLDQTALGGIVNMLPKSVKRSLIKNPALLDYAMGFMAKHAGGSPALENHDNGSNHQVKFKL